MIIKKITINNYRSYYKENSFDISEGLTIIIGDNGDGKTTFFDALDWLFKTGSDDKSIIHVSEKRKSEMEVGDLDKVSVSISFEHNGYKEIEKSFSFKKIANNKFETDNYEFVGYENHGSERSRIKGDVLLNSCFETVIRKYCLFKGEENLNVFQEPTALTTLVDTFSDVRQLSVFENLTQGFASQAERATRKEQLNDKKTKDKTAILDTRLLGVKQKIFDKKESIEKKESIISDFTEKLETIFKYQDIAENYKKLKDRVDALKQTRIRERNWSSCNYSTNLLDENWILRPFPSIINEFQRKVAAINKEKRRLKREDEKQKAKEEGKREAIESIQKLANDAVPLPWNLPDEETMKEMLQDEVCKVCGRPAPKGSDAYLFMQEKLNSYLRHIQEESKLDKKKEEKPLFSAKHIDDLMNKSIKLSGDVELEINSISAEIADQLDFIAKHKEQLKIVETQIEEAESDIVSLLVQSPGLTPEMLDKSFSDWRGYSESNKKAEIQLEELKRELRDLENEEAEIKKELSEIVPSSAMGKVYQRVQNAFESIFKAFSNAKEENIRNFLSLLQEKANEYLAKLNENDFHGTIKIRRKVEHKDGKAVESASIELNSINDDGEETLIALPNGALKTTMYMSVLFAISNITTLKRDQDYPLIFDAPTSSFGGFKEDVFYNVIDKIDKQCIIVTKDLLIADRENGTKVLDIDTINKLTCSVYRIEKKQPFNNEDLSTIQTIVKAIK